MTTRLGKNGAHNIVILIVFLMVVTLFDMKIMVGVSGMNAFLTKNFAGSGWKMKTVNTVTLTVNRLVDTL